MPYNSESNRARNLKFYSRNCTPLGPITITNDVNISLTFNFWEYPFSVKVEEVVETTDKQYPNKRNLEIQNKMSKSTDQLTFYRFRLGQRPVAQPVEHRAAK